MLRRLVEAHYFANQTTPGAVQLKFWLTELRTPELLAEIAKAHAPLARRLAAKRPLLKHAVVGDLEQLETALAREENILRAKDKAYWSPLLKELEHLLLMERNAASKDCVTAYTGPPLSGYGECRPPSGPL
jgi:hypothetical protein